ncbi:MAG: dTDP-4-dehydrorhamnose 3,5-epimerase [Armatimonadetes bacterium]|nr:MAG: dTDP-4-dehydrorhamnose 3,5-epimerase [Armatimonadota bacterium]
MPEVLLIHPTVHEDRRGTFRETFSEKRLRVEHGIDRDWPQDNHSNSHANVLRGIHFQLGAPQGKLVSCMLGSIFDVAVDLRPDSSSFGLWVGTELSRSNGLQLWIPEGFGHGFLVLTESADVTYKVTCLYQAGSSRTLAYDDPSVAVAWPINGEPILSEEDARGLSLDDVRELLTAAPPDH